MICKIQGCDRPTRRNEMCNSHSSTIYLRANPERKAWHSMKSRCLNPNDQYYRHYGGRGITICDRWLKSFDNFLIDMGPRPSKLHSIDRIDNNGGYSPKNCRWATKTQQAQNRRMGINNSTGVTGVSRKHNGFEVLVQRNGVRRYYGKYKTLEEAIAVRRSI